MNEKEIIKLIEEKIKANKGRAAPKRKWAKFAVEFLDSSINYRMELSEQAVFVKMILMSVKFGPIPGLISDNDCRAMPHEFLAHEAHCPVEVFESALDKAKQDESIFENGHGIYLIHFDDYQFTEYDRQKPYREKKKELMGSSTYKVCEKCGHKEKTAEEVCPECGGTLGKDYTAGKYGHMVKK